MTQATSLGIPSGTPIIYDMEAYRSGCTQAVTTFLSAWDSQLHARGYVAGIYESFSNISDLVSAADQITEPDIIHYADWDGHATTNSSYMPADMWTSHQRIHQYKGGHNETYGGTTVNIDNDQLDVTLSGTPTGGGGGGGSALRPAFRIAVALNANTSAEWFARAANGTVRHNYQHPIGSASLVGHPGGRQLAVQPGRQPGCRGQRRRHPDAVRPDRAQARSVMPGSRTARPMTGSGAARRAAGGHRAAPPAAPARSAWRAARWRCSPPPGAAAWPGPGSARRATTPAGPPGPAWAAAAPARPCRS